MSRWILFLLLASGVLRAQSEPTLEELRAAAEQLEQAVATERTHAAERLAEFERRKSALTAEINDEAERLLTLEERRQALIALLSKKVAEAADAEQRANALRDRTEEIAQRIVVIAEQYSIAGSEAPGDPAIRATLAQIVAKRRSDDPSYPKRAFEALVALHDEASTVKLRDVTLVTAKGVAEPVQLLTLGHMGAAYRTKDAQRFALMLNSPTDATGFRWTEDLPDDLKDVLAKAMEDAASPGTSVIFVPTDVTRSLRVETALDQTTLWDRLWAGGPVMIPLGVVALLALLIILERTVTLLRAGRGGDRAARRILAAVDARDLASVDQIGNANVIARTLTACLERRDAGALAMEDAANGRLLHELPRLERFLGSLAILGAIAPLLGLLGTVTGIIETFGVIEVFGNGDPGLMAGGISEALVTTATGLVIAIPILIIHGLLRGKVDRIVADAERHTATLIQTLGEQGNVA